MLKNILEVISSLVVKRIQHNWLNSSSVDSAICKSLVTELDIWLETQNIFVEVWVYNVNLVKRRRFMKVHDMFSNHLLWPNRKSIKTVSENVSSNTSSNNEGQNALKETSLFPSVGSIHSMFGARLIVSNILHWNHPQDFIDSYVILEGRQSFE